MPWPRWFWTVIQFTQHTSSNQKREKKNGASVHQFSYFKGGPRCWALHRKNISQDWVSAGTMRAAKGRDRTGPQIKSDWRGGKGANTEWLNASCGKYIKVRTSDIKGQYKYMFVVPITLQLRWVFIGRMAKGAIYSYKKEREGDREREKKTTGALEWQYRPQKGRAVGEEWSTTIGKSEGTAGIPPAPAAFCLRLVTASGLYGLLSSDSMSSANTHTRVRQQKNGGYCNHEQASLRLVAFQLKKICHVISGWYLSFFLCRAPKFAS